MKIGIDLKPFSTGSKFRGIGMYSRELIRELLKIDNDFEYHFLNLYQKYDGDPELNDKCHLYQYNMGPKIVDVGERQLFRDFRTTSVIEGAVKHFIEKSDIDVMFFTSPNEYGNMYKAEWFDGVYKVGILYDLIPLMFPNQCLFDKTYTKDYQDSLEFLKGLDLLLAISQSAKDDAVKLLGIPEEKIVVIYAGIDSDYKKLEKVNVRAVKEKYHIKDSFIMFAGGIDFKKNIEDLIAAYARCGKEITNKYQFVIVGKIAQDVIDKYMQIAREEGVEGRVLCTGFIPKEDLIALYNITDLLVFPSLYEGFGLPVIEAMACGARVVTSNVSSLKEIAEGHATLVSPKSVKSITNGIKSVFDHPVETLALAENSISYAKSFTWKAVAEKTADAIQKGVSPKEKQKYTFTVQEKLVRDIARLYMEKGFPFPQAEREEIAEELVCIENHTDMPEFCFKNRLIFDMTVVHEWMKANYSTGIGRVSKELYRELKKKMQVIPVIVKGGNEGIQCNEISLDNYEVIQENIEIRGTDIFFMPEIQLRGVQVPQKHPYANELRKKGVHTYAVIYDILPLRMPEYFEKKTGNQFDPYVREIVDNYDGILCDSKAVADDIIAYCEENRIKPENNVKMGYFHLGQDTFEKKIEGHISGEIKSFLDTDENVFLMLGTVEPRKGHEIVLKAFEQMWKEGKTCKLCIVGHVGWNMDKFVQRLKHHERAGKELMFFEGVNDNEVRYVYEHVNCLIQASAGEGFGLPLIEASNYNLPIICSDIDVFHEVAGDNANYFKREDTEDLIRVISMVGEGKGVMTSNGIPKLSWKDVADKVFAMIVQGEKWYKNI